MKLFINNGNERILRGIRELGLELDNALMDDDITINLVQDDHFEIEYADDEFTVCYSKENNVYFSLSFIVGLVLRGEAKNGYRKEFSSSIETLTFMIDCSRNAVPKVVTLKKLIRILSLMGYDSLMLYTEDTYEVKEYPYFGYLRNPYTEDEIKEIDEYAQGFGIELIPCIQTLAHFNSLIRHISMKDMFDVNDILLVGDDKTYDFIDCLIKSCRNAFSSKKIHIGMDEAFMLGRGEYLNRNGYRPRFDIMCEHLKNVIEICRKYDFEPMMWSDMFVSIAQSETSELESKKHLVPSGVELIYWDYYSMEESHYSEYIGIHKRLDNKIGFAGGAWKWLGFSPDNRFSLVATRESMKAVNKESIKNYIVTAWGDNGGECSHFATMPAMLYASYSRYREYDISEDFKSQFYAITGMNYHNFMAIDLLNRTTRNDDPYERSCANKYLLYNDPLLGTLDTTITKDIRDIYNEHCPKLKYVLSVSGRWDYIFKTQYELAKVLSIKADLGARLRSAYKKDNTRELEALRSDCTTLLGYIDSFKKTYRTEWNTENKPNGIDVFDIRIGALIERLNVTREKLEDYLSGRIDSIPELEETLLDFLGNGERFKEDYNQCEYRWRRMTSVNVND